MVAYERIGEGDEGAIDVDGYIYSPQRLYFAVLEANGQFNVYAGETPDDPGKVQVWSTNSTVPSGWEVRGLLLRNGPFDHSTKKLQIIMTPLGRTGARLLWGSGGSGDLTSPIEGRLGDDGRLILRQNQQGTWIEQWNNGFSDPVVEFVPETIDFDRPKAKITSDNNKVGVLEGELENKSPVKEEKMGFSRAATTTVVSNWSNTVGFKATIGAKLTVDVPKAAKAEVSWSSEFSNAFTFGKSTSDGYQISFNFELVVPPLKTYRGWANIIEAEMEVPYSVFGELRFRSGRRIKHRFSGIYQGKNGYLGKYVVDDITGGKITRIREEGA